MKQFKKILFSMFILLSTGLYANMVNMSPIITYLLSSTATPLTFENNTPVFIIDGGSNGAATTSEINVTGAATSIKKVTITLDITHSWITDLEIRLKSPLGTPIILSDVDIFGAINYVNTTFDDDAVMSITNEDGNISGTYSPVEPLAEFNEEDPNGTWTLEVHDKIIANGGTLNSWSITFLLSDSIAATPVSFADDVMLIFEANCQSCHPTSGSKVFKVGDAAFTYDNIIDESLINTTLPDSSLLLIRGNGVGHSKGDKLSDTESTIIRDWIEQGGLNN